MEPFAKGKRGLVFLTKHRGRPAIVKKKNPAATINTIKHEADMLQYLNQFGLGPKFYEYKRGALTREFIDGAEFADYLEKATKKEIIRVLTEIFYQCREMDLLGVNKFELTRPYKHILISKKTRFRKRGEVVQIDFERCKQTDKPKNVTQFVQCVSRGKLQTILKEKKTATNTDKLMELSKNYKHKLEKKYFDQIIKELGGVIRKPVSFSQKVYHACASIPEGKVGTYKTIAQAVKTKSFRGVGQALRNNPYAPRVPCHRVVASDGSIGGFHGQTKGKQIQRKIALLASESIIIENGKIKDFNSVTFESS